MGDITILTQDEKLEGISRGFNQPSGALKKGVKWYVGKIQALGDKIYQWIEKRKDQRDSRTTEEIISDAAEYLRENKGEMLDISQKDMKEAIESSLKKADGGFSVKDLSVIEQMQLQQMAREAAKNGEMFDKQAAMQEIIEQRR